MEFVVGMPVTTGHLSRTFPKEIQNSYREYVRARERNQYGIIIEEIAGQAGRLFIVDYRDDHGEACGKRAIHFDYELEQTFPRN